MARLLAPKLDPCFPLVLNNCDSRNVQNRILNAGYRPADVEKALKTEAALVSIISVFQKAATTYTRGKENMNGRNSTKHLPGISSALCPTDNKNYLHNTFRQWS